MTFPIQTRALTLASRERGVTSVDLAKRTKQRVSQASSNLGDYARAGLLTCDRSCNPFRYRITEAGRLRLNGIAPEARKAYDYKPLWQAMGWP